MSQARIETRKKLWLITYGAACKDITHEILIEQGVSIDECYTAKWRESKYTLIHCSKGNRLSPEALTKIVEKLKHLHGITLQATVIGYESLTSVNKQRVDSLEDHPGFRKITELLNKRSEDLTCWIEGGKDVYEYRKGVLWKSIESTDPSKMTRAQLVALVRTWTPIVNGHTTLKEAYEAQASVLEKYKTSLKSTNEITEMQKREIDRLFEEKKLLSNQLIEAGMCPADMQ